MWVPAQWRWSCLMFSRYEPCGNASEAGLSPPFEFLMLIAAPASWFACLLVVCGMNAARCTFGINAPPVGGAVIQYAIAVAIFLMLMADAPSGAMDLSVPAMERGRTGAGGGGSAGAAPSRASTLPLYRCPDCDGPGPRPHALGADAGVGCTCLLPGNNSSGPGGSMSRSPGPPAAR